MKTFIAAAIISLALIAPVSAQQSQFAPLQEAHNGLWFDPEQSGILVQVYPFYRDQQSAFVAVNFALDGGGKTWLAFLFDNFYGYSRRAVEDTLIGAPSNDTHRPNWTIAQKGATCDAMTLTRRDEFGVVTLELDLVRIVAQNTDAICYTCPEAAAGPHPPLCRR